MIATVDQLGTVAEYTGEVANTTAKMNNRMDVLLAELDTSVHNFRFLAKIKGGLETVKNILDETLKNTVGRILPAPEEKSGSVKETPKEQPASQSPKETEPEEKKPKGGLLRRLLEPLLP